MMKVRWTKEQQEVIDLRDCNILVSAAAGSGKTAVLVERIITRLTLDTPPLNVDELLVVTYTEAAAAEMKERILGGIEKALEKDPENEHLQRQSTLINQANITTIHSFCLSVIRDHFHAINLDPGFRIADEGELKLLQQDVLDELLEGCYEKGEEAFLEFVECFATGKDDQKVGELILQLYNFSRSYPEPKMWLENTLKPYNETHTNNCSYINRAMKNVKAYLFDAMEMLHRGIAICGEEDGPYMYEKALVSDLNEITEIYNCLDFAEIYDKIKRFGKVSLVSNRDKEVSLQKAEYVKNLRSDVKKNTIELREKYFFKKLEKQQEDMKKASSMVEELVKLTKFFSEAISAKKREKNIIDFGDMEHFALQILTKKENEKLVPSEVANEYQNKFAEVMIDEYQDSNFLQEAILTSVSRITQGRHNIFMVGDVKQSIYGFRLSRPELFMEKFDTYSQREGVHRRIDLHKNFRSREEVLSGVNFIFEKIMTKALGGIAYNEEVALHMGASYEEQTGNKMEVLLIDTDTSEEKELGLEDTNRELEARAVARRIKELVKNHDIFERKTGKYRQAQFKDIVILTRSLKGWTDVFSKILNDEGVPTYAGTREGYFKTWEIGLILDYLRILDNPKQDVPLVAVLTSPLVGLTNEMLAEIKVLEKNASFHEVVWKYKEQGKNKEIRNKIEHFISVWEYFRDKTSYTGIHSLLWEIMEKTGFEVYASAMPGGEQRKANLEMLINQAISFEATSYKGLFNFVRYIDQLKKYDIDYGEASLNDEQTNSVRMMSIHKSKGLEFPIVFVVGMSKRFNTQDSKGKVIIHPELGIGIDAMDTSARTKTTTLLKEVIKKEVTLENLGEELRVLYVALTRAKEKLIITGTVSKLEKKLEISDDASEEVNAPLTFTRISNASTYYDWVIPSLIRNKDLAEASNIQVSVVNLEELMVEEGVEEVTEQWTKSQILDMDVTQTFDYKFRKQLERQLLYHYPYEKEQQIKLKVTVSELKKREYTKDNEAEILYEEAESQPLLLECLQEKKILQGASRGTAYHKLMELLDLKKTYTKEGLQEEIEMFYRSGKLTEEMKQVISITDILKFLESSIGQRMQKATQENLLKVEQPFVLGVPAKEVYPEENTQETVLIQGIIDAYFEEEGKLVVVDYKTDQVRSSEELRNRYQSQLSHYAHALEQLTEKRVVEKIIYSFTLHEEVSL